MRRTARALSVAALTGAALAGAAPPAPAGPAARAAPASVPAGPAAEVDPAVASPGGTVTVSVTCDPTGGSPPPAMDATSEAFDEGTVALNLVPTAVDPQAGPVYRGTALIASAADLESDPAGLGPDTAWTVDGTCPAAPGGQGKPWSATFTVTRTAPASPCPRPQATCPPAPAPVQHGVRAGEGGAFTDSVPALVVGGLFIAGAFGGAVYRLRRRTPARDA
ncbi:hypothetical protein [Streptomyces sp. NPDC093094]|uniref:hypothetical protein n=1 Tax=Streptomyces sp. NPDC093094 TaxID=3366026 RepID=UPI003811028B